MFVFKIIFEQIWISIIPFNNPGTHNYLHRSLHFRKINVMTLYARANVHIPL